MIELFAAFQFLSIFPPLIRRPFTARELGRSVGLYPLVGLTFGGIFVGVAAGFGKYFSPLIVAVLVLMVWVIVTRALHLDGFMDMCDGLFGGFTPERRLEIMRDSRVGAFGVAGGVLILLLKAVLLVDLLPHPFLLLLVPVVGRWAITLAMVWFPYARPTGMGRDLKDNARWPQFLVATIITMLAIYLAAGAWVIIIWALLTLPVVAWLYFVLSKIPGLTGDIYGATCELAEIWMMFALLIWAGPIG